ncbi:MAG: hypothetical protein ABL861_03690 [Nitrosomonas sp.]
MQKEKNQCTCEAAKKHQTGAKVSREVRLAKKKPIAYGDARNRQVTVTGENK